MLNKTKQRSWTSTLRLMMHFHISCHDMHILLASQVIGGCHQMFATINSGAAYPCIFLSLISVTAEACVCNTLVISLLADGKYLGLSFHCGTARYRCDVCRIKEVPHILVHAIDHTHGLFEMFNSIDMGDPRWLTNHLVYVCMCLIHHYNIWRRRSVRSGYHGDPLSHLLCTPSFVVRSLDQACYLGVNI